MTQKNQDRAERLAAALRANLRKRKGERPTPSPVAAVTDDSEEQS